MRRRRFGATLALAVLATVALTESARADGTSLRLDEAVQLALARNENAKIADDQVVVADAAVDKARAAFLPIISATGTGLGRPYQVSKSGTVVLPYDQATSNATISQPVLVASAFPLLRQAQRLLDAQRASTIDAKRLLAFDAATAFFQTLSSEQVLQAAKRSADATKANLLDTQARVDAQLNSSNDVTRAQLDLANAQQQIANNAGTVERAYIQLGFVLNVLVKGPLPSPTRRSRPPPRPRRGSNDTNRHRRPAAPGYSRPPGTRRGPRCSSRTSRCSGSPHRRRGRAGSPANSFASGGRTFDETASATATWTIYDAGVRYADKRSRDGQANIAYSSTVLARSVGNDVRNAIASLLASQNAFTSPRTRTAPRSRAQTRPGPSTSKASRRRWS